MSRFLTIDVREGSMIHVVSEAAKLRGFGFRIAQLPCSDYAFGDATKPAVIYERKTVYDFRSSLMDGRLFEQAENMTASCDRARIIVEGTYEQLVYGGDGINSASVRAAVFSLWEKRGVQVFFAGDHFVECLFGLAEKALDETSVGRALVRRNIDSRIGIIASIPGIGTKRAQKLLAKYGSPIAVITALSKGDVDIPGIGLETVTRARAALEVQDTKARE